MKNGYSVYWTAEAESNLRNVLNYLSNNFSDKEISIFVKKLEKRLAIISVYPKSFRKSKIKNIHRSVLTKHITIYYKFDNQKIEIISLFDVRQNPKKLNISQT
jgi:plasmid stabilization system protein ParE